MGKLQVLLLRIGFYLGIALTGVLTLRDVRINVPLAVVRGSNATMDCLYDLEGDQLYAVQWYLGTKEFYRYTLKEIPPIKQFGSDIGLYIRENESNATRVVLEHVPMSVSGRYSCEVSADAPSFFTSVQSAYLQVVDLPPKHPYISGLKTRYHIEDVVKANCTSEHSNPPANLTWYVNGKQADKIHVHNYRHKSYDGQSYTAHSVLRLKITKQLFSKHRLKIRCVARMYDIYYQSNEKSVELTKRRHSHVHIEATTTAETPLQWELAQAAEHPKTKLVFVAPVSSGASSTTLKTPLCILIFALLR